MGKEEEITPNEHLPGNTLIKQPVSQDLKTENGVLQLTEKWKGLYVHCQGVAKGLYSAETVFYSEFTALAGVREQKYPTPAPPPNMVWRLAQATADEAEAGENGILTVIWNAVPDPSGGDPFEDWPVTETWQLQWQPENYDVYAYCKNPRTHQTDPRNGSQRVAVENCLHPPQGQNVMTQQELFTDNDGLVVGLNDNEKKILKWKLEGKHVIKHHPVIRLTKVWSNVPEAYKSSIIAGASKEIKPVDTTDDPKDPFGLKGGWQYVCQGTNVQVTQPDLDDNQFRVQTDTEWYGALSVVTEFYGPDAQRWEFGEM